MLFFSINFCVCVCVFSFFCCLLLPSFLPKPLSGKIICREKMYPKVRVRVQSEEADQYSYEKSSLQSLKAFEWLSLQNFSSSDDSPGSVVRVPRSYAPKSPPPSFYASKVAEENQKNVRANSAPRPRAVLSSPDNDGILGSRTQARQQLFSALKKQNPCQNRHSQCRIFPKSEAAGSLTPTQGHNKESVEPRNHIQAKARTTIPANSSIRAGGNQKKTASSSVHI